MIVRNISRTIRRRRTVSVIRSLRHRLCEHELDDSPQTFQPDDRCARPDARALVCLPRCGGAGDDPHAYRRFAEWIWQGAVQRVIHELKTHQQRLGLPEKDAGEADPRQRIHRALTYYTNHRRRMNYAEYRRDGLPLTSSHIESAIKQINARVKGTEKFWRNDHANAVLQLRADSLSDWQPMDKFWIRWRANLTGANQYRTTVL